LTPGKRDVPSILLEARGAPFGGLPLQNDVTAQLIASDGACWQADYREFIHANGPAAFRARAGIYRPCHACDE
jgi:hypothetical protein